MEWHEVVARARARLDAAPTRTRVRAVASAVVVVVLVVAVLAFAAARSGSAASPAGAAGANGYPPSSADASRSSAPAASSAPSVSTGATAATAPVVVSVAGAVARPGVVTLPFGARVVDAIAAAGGARTDADPNSLDLAAKLVDGARVYVPKVGEHVSPMPVGSTNDTAGNGSAGGDTSAAAPSGPVDLNTASEAELEALPGIGPSLAQAIITTRTRLGGFRSIDELREVHGIGDRRFADLRPLVTI